MRRRRRRRRWRRWRAMGTLLLVVLAAGAFAALPPATVRDAQRLVRGHLDALEKTVGPAVEQAAHWFADGAGALRETFGDIWRVEFGGDALRTRTRRRWGYPQDPWDANPPARHRRAGERAALPGRGSRLALRPGGGPRGGPRALATNRRAEGRVRGARPGPLRARRRGVPGRGRGCERLDGPRRLGVRVQQILAELRRRGVGGEGGRPRHLARRGGTALGVAPGQASSMTDRRPLFHTYIVVDWSARAD